MKRTIIISQILIYILMWCSTTISAQSGYGTGGNFNPDSPGVPGGNGLYLDQGLLVLDGFKYDNISETIWDLWEQYCRENGITSYSDIHSQEKRTAVFGRIRHIIVCGELKSENEDQNIYMGYQLGYDFPNVTTLDLSRTYGWDADASLGEWTSLQVLILPDCVELLPSFYELDKLTDIYLYAEVPPMVATYWYDDKPIFSPNTYVTLHVPAGSMDFYMASDWSAANNIVALDQNMAKIEVIMPQGADLQQLRNMQLVLTDEVSLLSTRYVVTDRPNYIFPGLNADEGITYAVNLQNRLGTSVSQLTAIKPQLGVNIVQLPQPVPVGQITAAVTTPDGTDVTSQVRLAWLDADGHHLTSSATLAGLVAGDQPRLNISLSAALARSYGQPADVTATVGPGQTESILPVRLEPLRSHTVTATVRDAASRQPLSGITVTAVQTLAEDLTNTFTTQSDSRGQVALQVLEGPLTVSFSSQEYLRHDVPSTTLFASDGLLQLGDVMLDLIQGMTVSLNLTTQEPVLEGESDGFIDSPEPSKLLFTAYDKTQQKVLTDLSVQYPLLVLPQWVESGDELELTVVSTTGIFDDFTVDFSVDGRSTAVDAVIPLRGGFRSTFRSTQNSSVSAVLYDADGHLVNTYLHTSATLTVTGLKEGYYTLVTMGSDPVLSSLTTIEDLSAAGMRLNLDYVQNEFHVSPATITRIDIDDVPQFNSEALKVTQPNAIVSVSKEEVIQGSYTPMPTA